MNKTSIKIIKRKDAQIMVNTKTQSACKPKQSALVSEEKTRRRARREIVATVSDWISERRENNRTEQINAFRKMFGNKPVLSEI